MDLLHKILNYPQDTKDLRDKKLSAQENLKNEFDDASARIDQKIQLLRDQIEQCRQSINERKGAIKSKISYNFQKQAYNSLSEFVDVFSMSDALFSSDSKNADLEELKGTLLQLLKRVKEIKEVLIPSVENEKHELENKYKIDLLEIENQISKELDNVRLPLVNEYNQSYEHRLVFNNDMFHEPAKSDLLPDYITIGNYLVPSTSELQEIADKDPLEIPIDIDVRNHGNIILKIDSDHVSNEDEKRIDRIITGIAMKYIESFPSGSIELGVFSPSITAFKHLTSLFAGSVKGKMAMTEESCKTREQFSRLLISATAKGEQIMAKLLENQCDDLYELYEKDIKTEKFRLIIVHNAFKDMSEDNLNQLHGCISNLDKCGIRFIIVDDFNNERYKNKPGFLNKVNQILDFGLALDVEKESIHNEDNINVNLLSCDNLTPQDIYSFITKYCKYAEEKKAPYVPYERIGFGTSEADKNNFNSIVIPVALDEPNVWNIEFDVVGSSPTANLIIGVPGTGKSTLIDSLIMNGAMKYSPDELNFQLLDFKDGISSSVYTMEDCKIPHVKVVSQNNKSEEAEIILSNILAEGVRRNKEFMALSNETHKEIKDIVGYNRLVASGEYGRKNMPRLIIVIDECQYLFEEENLAKKCQDIIRKCRSQGIHFILATQTLSHKMRNTIKFVQGLYCFEITKEDAEELIQNRKYIPLISKEVPKGSYMAFASNDGGQNCEKIKIAFDGGNTSQYSRRIRDKWFNYPIDIVTIGDKSARTISENEYDELLSGFDSNEFPIGDNYTDHKPIAIAFDRKRPMLLVGSNEKPASSILKLVYRTAFKNNLEAYVIDASNNQDLKKYADKHNYEKASIGDERDYLSTLEKVYNVYHERSKNIRGEYEPIFFIINGLQNIQDFRNNVKNEAVSEDSKQELDTITSMKELIERQQNSRAASPSQAITGKETLVSVLMSLAEKTNIFICASLDTISLTSDLGEQVFTFTHKNVLRSSDYKLLYQSCNGDIRSIMEDSFKEKMLDGLSDDMAFLSIEKQKEFYKIKYYQLEDE